MLYWNPTTTVTTEWQPKAGWNTTFSDQDKIKCMNLFFFFKSKKGFSEAMSEILAQMAVYKHKYHGMKYSEEQENMLAEALKPIFNTE